MNKEINKTGYLENNTQQQLPNLAIAETCCFTGPRPDNLYGYNMSDERYSYIYERLLQICEQLIIKFGVKNFIAGGALGFDTLAYTAIKRLKKKYPDIKIVIMIPFKEYNKKWSIPSKIVFNNMINNSDYFVEIDKVKKYNPNLTNVGRFEYFKYQERNKAMVDLSKYICSCYDGRSSGGTFNCINYIREDYKFNKRIVLNINKEDFSIQRLEKAW